MIYTSEVMLSETEVKEILIEAIRKHISVVTGMPQDMSRYFVTQDPESKGFTVKWAPTTPKSEGR